VSIRIERVEAAGLAEPRPADTTATDVRRPVRRAVPPLVAMDTTLEVSSGDIVLVIYDPERETLAVRGGS
jgi:hypothetical protein